MKMSFQHQVNLDHLIIRTPLIPYHSFDSAAQAEIYLKPENLQRFGSYKIRGIASVIKANDADHLQHGLCAASAGNMAQAVAFAAQQLNVPCHIYVPDTAPQIKKMMIQKLGANLVELSFEDIWTLVRDERIVSNQGLFIHPAFNEDLLHGYATIAEEMMEDLPDVEAVVIPFGVGGLSLGVGRALHHINPDIAIYTCEPETAAPLKASLMRGHTTTVKRIPSFVDAIGVGEVLPRVFQQLAPILADSLVISLKEAEAAFNTLLLRHKLVCEGAAACGFAAAIELAKQNKHRKIICLLTGGNISQDVMQKIMREHKYQ